jgi:hypothetical protein
MKIRSTLVLAMLVAWTAAPVLRCMIPSASMTQEERACCQAMGNNCGDMENHSCCKKTSPASQAALLVASASAPQFVAQAVPASQSVGISVPMLIRNEFIATSPPLSARQSSVLRI